MITGKTIHNWLQQPDSLTQDKLTDLYTLRTDYPFFSPADLLLHFFEKGNARDLALEELHGHDPVIFYYWNTETRWPPHATGPVQDKLLALKDSANEGGLLEYEKEQSDNKDYFRMQGIRISDDLPDRNAVSAITASADRSLMVVMSFGEWLQFLQRKTKKEQEEEEEKRALKAQWQKQKMAEAIEEENEEIPATVFEMAVNSISREDGIISESMAVVYTKQGKITEAINIYKKLSLNNPEKSVYFADKIENLQKEI